MPINPDLLIAAPMLQDYLVDKDGTPMSGGTVTCYHDNSRTTLKNWYYQSGTPGNYTYIRLPNPLTLSAAGTIEDVNGVDTIPFFYPYDEENETTVDPYYITIVNFAQTNQITRANFPFLGNINNQASTVNTFNNLIINNGFWRNIAPNDITHQPFIDFDLSQQLDIVVAPSQHDGFQYPDIHFIKNNKTAIDKVIFTPFPESLDQPIQNFISPEYYLNHICSSAGTTEEYKYYQFPISLHLNTLANIIYTFTIQAKNSGGTSNGQNIISAYLLQDTGTGTVPPTRYLIDNITLNGEWTNYSATNIFPSPSGFPLGPGSDDAFYLQIEIPINTVCNINFTKPSIYLADRVFPNNDFQTYDQVDSIISSPRTGDIRISLNRFYPFGWVPMNDGTIGNSKSNATAIASQDAWPLFNLLWNLFSNYTNANINLLAQMYSSTGVMVPYGISAISDWSANNTIALTKMMGRVILGGAPKLLSNYSSNFSSVGPLITTTNNMSFFNGMPVYFTNTTILSKKSIYFVSNFVAPNKFNLASTFADAMAGMALPIGVDSGIVSSTYQGSYEGEYAHTQLVSELAPHDHTFDTHRPTSPTDTSASAGGNPLLPIIPQVTNIRGGGNPFNVTQPGTFYNMYIKL